MEMARRTSVRTQNNAEIAGIESQLFKLKPEISLDELEIGSLPSGTSISTPNEKTIELPTGPREQNKLVEELNQRAEHANKVATILEHADPRYLDKSALGTLFTESRSKVSSLLFNLNILTVGLHTLSFTLKITGGRPVAATANLALAAVCGSLFVFDSPSTKRSIADWFRNPQAKLEANKVLRKVREELNTDTLSIDEAETLVKNIAKEYREKATHLAAESKEVSRMAANWRSDRPDSLKKEIVESFHLDERPRVVNSKGDLWDYLYCSPDGVVRAQEMSAYVKTALLNETEPELIGVENRSLYPLNTAILDVRALPNRTERITSYRELADRLGQFSAIMAKREMN